MSIGNSDDAVARAKWMYASKSVFVQIAYVPLAKSTVPCVTLNKDTLSILSLCQLLPLGNKWANSHRIQPSVSCHLTPVSTLVPCHPPLLLPPQGKEKSRWESLCSWARQDDSQRRSDHPPRHLSERSAHNPIPSTAGSRPERMLAILGHYSCCREELVLY